MIGEHGAKEWRHSGGPVEILLLIEVCRSLPLLAIGNLPILAIVVLRVLQPLWFTWILLSFRRLVDGGTLVMIVPTKLVVWLMGATVALFLGDLHARAIVAANRWRLALTGRYIAGLVVRPHALDLKNSQTQPVLSDCSKLPMKPACRINRKKSAHQKRFQIVIGLHHILLVEWTLSLTPSTASALGDLTKHLSFQPIRPEVPFCHKDETGRCLRTVH